MEDWIKFKDDQFEDNGKLLLGMRELRQMLSIIKKQKRIDKFLYQFLRDIVKV